MSFVTKQHHDTYPAIDPTRPELSFAKKTIIVTGAGAGIGRNTVLEIAKAGSGPIHIVGRTSKSLEETKDIVETEVKDAKVIIHVADIADEDAMKTTAAKIGPWDVYIATAGLFPAKSTIEKADLKKWWQGFEVNVKGAFIQYQAFLSTHKPGAAIVGFSTGGLMFPINIPLLSGGSSYLTSKIAETKFYQYVAAENDPNDLQIMIIHPGIVQTAMAEIAEVPEGTPMDTVDLASHFAMWAASKEAKFAHGKFIMSNWDIEELQAHKDKFEDPLYLTFNLVQ